MLGRRYALVFGLAGLTACTLVTPLDGLVGGAVTPASEEASVDAGGDAPTGEDANPVPDADAGDSSGVTSRYAAAVLQDAPVRYFRFGEDAGSGVVDTVTGLRVERPVSGVSIGAPGALIGDPDTAVSFDGSGRLLLPAGEDFPGTAAFTIEFWIKDATPTPLCFVVDHTDYSSGRKGWSVFAGDNLGFERYASASNFNGTATPSPSKNEWHHVVATTNGTQQSVFVDGILKANNTVTATLPALSIPYAVGGQNCDCSGQRFVGVLDELAIYDKALLSERIATHFAAGR